MAVFKTFDIVITVIYILLVQWCYSSGLGSCPRHDFVKNFNVTKFAGHWYEIERSFYLMELTASCTTIDLTENFKGQLEVSVKTLSRWTGNIRVSEGVATPSRRDRSIMLYRVNSGLPTSLAKFLPGAGFYQVLNTDYNEFAILWSCTNLGLLHAGSASDWGFPNLPNTWEDTGVTIWESLIYFKLMLILTLENNFLDRIWILGREKEIEVNMRASIYDFLKARHIDSDRLILPKNNNCTDEY